MTAPRTRLDEAESEFERDLLGSYENEGPSAASRRKALGLLGGAGVAAAITTTTSASATAGAVATKAGAAGLLAVARWLVVGALVTGGSVATYSIAVPETAERAAPPAPIALPTPVVATVAPSAPVVVATPAPEAPPPPAEPAPTAHAVTVHAPVAAPAPAPVPTPEPVAAAAPVETAPAPPPKTSLHALGDQVALVDRARTALAAGDAASALQLVDEYDARFPGGTLAQESATLRIEALLRQGKRPEATALGQRFVASQPKSPYAAKIRRLLDLP